jgi:hypothetical protein
VGQPNTTRLGIPQYEDSEPAAFSTQVNAISKKVDEKAVTWLEGTLAARPAAGVKGRLYFVVGDATEANNGLLFQDTGTEWREINTVRQSPQATPQQTIVSWGRISSEGAIEAGSGDFTVTKAGTGLYEVKWSKAKSSGNYAVVVTPYNAFGYLAVADSITVNGFTVGAFLLTNSAEARSIPFSFVVLSPV